MHADGPEWITAGWLHTFDFHTWLPKAELQAGCLEIIDAIRAMRLVQCLHGFQFDQYRPLDQQVHEVVAYATACPILRNSWASVFA